jgi:hypothetical protein
MTGPYRRKLALFLLCWAIMPLVPLAVWRLPAMGGRPLWPLTAGLIAYGALGMLYAVLHEPPGGGV